MEQDLFVYGNTAWVTYKFLEKYKVPKQTIYNNTSKKSTEKWFVRSHPYSKKIKLIDYCSISISTIKKYGLPQYSELKAIYELQTKIVKEQYSKQASIIIKNILDIDYNNWDIYRSIYCNKLFDEQKIRLYCKTHALFSRILELHNPKHGFKLLDLFQAYCLYEELVFETTNFHSFANKVNKLKKAKSIEDELIHGLSGSIGNNLKVFEDVENEIKKHLANPKKFSATIITEKVNDYIVRTNGKPIAQSTVEAICAKTRIKNEISISRYGKRYLIEKMLPHEHFIPPHKEGLLWLMDGTRFQFAYKGEFNHYSFLTYYIVIDGYDKRIIGFSYDDGENTKMATEAFENACKLKQYLPTEIISDNSPAYRARDYTRMITEADRMGVNWRIILNRNPRDNNYVERVFGVIQEKYCKKYNGYIGDGIKSKNPNGRPSPEELTKNLTTKNLRTRDEVIELIKQVIADYNASIDRKQLMKKDQYEIRLSGKTNINPIPLDSSKFAKLFWSSRELKLQNGMISFQLDNELHYYNIYDGVIIDNHHGTTVRVRYCKENLKKIMLFELHEDKYICTLKETPPIPKVGIERNREQNNRLFLHSQKVKNIETGFREKIKEIEEKSNENWKKVPPELAEFSAQSKPIRENSENEIVNSEIEKLVFEKKVKVINKETTNIEKEHFTIQFDEKGTLKKL